MAKQSDHQMCCQQIELYKPFFINFVQSILAPVWFACAIPSILISHTLRPIIAMMSPSAVHGIAMVNVLEVIEHQQQQVHPLLGGDGVVICFAQILACR
jgi:hypothetical protein